MKTNQPDKMKTNEQDRIKTNEQDKMKTTEQDEIRQDENQNFEAVALHFPLMLLFPPRGKTTGIRFRELAAVEQLQFGDKSCQEIGLEWRREFEMKQARKPRATLV